MGGRPTYGTPHGQDPTGATPSGGGLVAHVESGSAAARAGVSPGDRIFAANGRVLTDVLAWSWESDGAEVAATVVGEASGAGREITLRREPGESWGITFSSALFDPVRTCRNSCAFCFMTQLPRGLRRALYVRDDDYRLSFLHGNFITLTNLTDDDVSRIVTEHLSPLHVSLHAVTPEVRSRLVCARDDRALERFDELVEGGIDLHVQIVLVPGENDAEELRRTLTWLAEREGVRSVGIVPLGFTAHQTRFSASYDDPVAAARLLDTIAPWASAMRARDGVGWVYAADEFYLTARREVPPAEEYDGFPQYENGIGLVRAFLDEWAALLGQSEAGGVSHTPPVPEFATAVVTGTMFAPVLERALADSPLTASVSVLPAANRLFGGNVAVTGLLGGRDIADAVASADLGGETRVLVPDVVLNADGLTLDDLDRAGVERLAGRPVTVVAANAEGLLSAIL